MGRLASTDTLRGRTGESRIALWPFPDANRCAGPFILRSSERTTAIDWEQ